MIVLALSYIQLVQAVCILGLCVLDPPPSPPVASFHTTLTITIVGQATSTITTSFDVYSTKTSSQSLLTTSTQSDLEFSQTNQPQTIQANQAVTVSNQQNQSLTVQIEHENVSSQDQTTSMVSSQDHTTDMVTSLDQTAQLSDTLFQSTISQSTFELSSLAVLSELITTKLDEPTLQFTFQVIAPSDSFLVTSLSIKNNSFQVQNSSASLIPIVVGIVLMLVLLNSLLFMWLAKRKTRKSSQYIIRGYVPEMTQLEHNQSSFSTTHMGGFTTAVNDQKEMSLPGFLMMQKDVDYVLLDKIGQGGFSTVFKGSLISTATVCAVKVLASKNPDQIQAFEQEFSLMNFFRGNQLFVQLLGYSLSPSSMVMYYYNRGNVEEVLSGRSLYAVWSQSLMADMLKDVSDALTFMHINGIAHCDIKPANVMLSENNRAVLADFGISQIVTNQSLLVKEFKPMVIVAGSIKYACPEMLQQSYGLEPEDKLKQDIYAFAVMAFEMLTRYPAFYGLNDTAIREAVVKGKRPQFPSSFVTQTASNANLLKYKLLIEDAWAQDVKKRPTIIEVARVFC